MPKRSNIFQKLILVLHKQLSKEANISESRMLIDHDTGSEVEVDIVIENKVSGVPFTIGIECTAKSRKATIEWYRSMFEKHRSLDISQTVLVSKSGFTKEVYNKAWKNNVHLLTLEEAEDYSWTSLIKKLARSTIVNIEFSPKSINLSFDKNIVEEKDIAFTINSNVVIEDELIPLGKYVMNIVQNAGITKAVLENYRKFPAGNNFLKVSFTPKASIQIITDKGEKAPIRLINAVIGFEGKESILDFKPFKYAGTATAYSEIDDISIRKDQDGKGIVSLARTEGGEIETMLCIPNKEKGNEFIEMIVTPKGKNITNASS